MNKKVLSLAFVSAAFFLGCTADGAFNTGDPDSVIWSKDIKGEPGPSGGGGGGYCQVSMAAISMPICCEEMSSQNCAAIASETSDVYVGSVVSSCGTSIPSCGGVF